MFLPIRWQAVGAENDSRWIATAATSAASSSCEDTSTKCDSFERETNYEMFLSKPNTVLAQSKCTPTLRASSLPSVNYGIEDKRQADKLPKSYDVNRRPAGAKLLVLSCKALPGSCDPHRFLGHSEIVNPTLNGLARTL